MGCEWERKGGGASMPLEVLEADSRLMVSCEEAKVRQSTQLV